MRKILATVAAATLLSPASLFAGDSSDPIVIPIHIFNYMKLMNVVGLVKWMKEFVLHKLHHSLVLIAC